MSRLEPITGTEIIDDIRLGHTFHEVNSLKRMIDVYKPAWFVEIGVHEGGLSYLLIPTLPEYVRYMGIEINCNLIRPQVRRLYADYSNTRLLCDDAFAIVNDVAKLPNKVIYCDGGNKAKELIAFAPGCEFGDIIMAHDFSDGQKVVGVEKYGEIDFPKPEVLPKDIKFLHEKFDRIEDKDILFGTRIVAFMRK